MATAIYAGSFDPITLGHLNIIRRAAKIFDTVVVCVMVNSAKVPMFTRCHNVQVDTSDKLLAEYAKQYDNAVLLRGLRAVSDFESETQMALVNKKLVPNLDTVFLTSCEKYTYISSSVVKEMARYGCDLRKFVPMEILDDVIERAKKREE